MILRMYQYLFLLALCHSALGGHHCPNLASTDSVFHRREAEATKILREIASQYPEIEIPKEQTEAVGPEFDHTRSKNVNPVRVEVSQAGTTALFQLPHINRHVIVATEIDFALTMHDNMIQVVDDIFHIKIYVHPETEPVAEMDVFDVYDGKRVVVSIDSELLHRKTQLKLSLIGDTSAVVIGTPTLHIRSEKIRTRKVYECEGKCCRQMQFVNTNKLMGFGDALAEFPSYMAIHTCVGRCASGAEGCCRPTAYETKKVLFWTKGGNFKNIDVEGLTIAKCGCVN